MLVPFATLPRPRRTRLTVGLIILAVAMACVMKYVATPEAQALVLYDSSSSRAFVLPNLVSVAEGTRRTWDGLADLADNRLAQELLLVLVDNLFAVGYGLGFGLVGAALAERASRRTKMPAAVGDLLRFGAACYPVAGVFDLIENQLVATLLFLPEGDAGELLILVARYCSIPKYDLSLFVAPAMVLLAGMIALASRLTANDSGSKVSIQPDRRGG